ncbi:MAG: sigma-70 family RNA polymerase sigma factor [Eubacterium sp.]|nr:sigma-70 family RNA polymerase sigma factor [Eubacterium sp.]
MSFDNNNVSDEEMIELIRGDSDEAMDALLNRYRPLVSKKANALFIMGGESEDLNQEGMIGLYKAIRDYNPDSSASFYTFASVCISRQMYKAVEASARKKHSPLNSYVSLENQDGSDEPTYLSDLGNSDPQEMYVERENYERIALLAKDILSPYERKVLTLYLEGMRTSEISSVLEKEPKSVDNAISRIRSKIQSRL